MAEPPNTGIAQALRDLVVGKYFTLANRLDRGGALQARKLSNGSVQLYWRYSLGGQTFREPIGPYDSSAPPEKLQPTLRGYGPASAMERCRDLAELHAQRATTGGLREAKAEASKKHAEAKVAEAEKAGRPLATLLAAYVDHLESQGRRSHIDGWPGPRWRKRLPPT